MNNFKILSLVLNAGHILLVKDLSSFISCMTFYSSLRYSTIIIVIGVFCKYWCFWLCIQLNFLFLLSVYNKIITILWVSIMLVSYSRNTKDSTVSVKPLVSSWWRSLLSEWRWGNPQRGEKAKQRKRKPLWAD